MKFDLFSKDDMHRNDDYYFTKKLILLMLAEYTERGVSPVDFTNLLKDAGVTVDGPYIVATDEFVLMARLKYAK